MFHTFPVVVVVVAASLHSLSKMLLYASVNANIAFCRTFTNYVCTYCVSHPSHHRVARMKKCYKVSI